MSKYTEKVRFALLWVRANRGKAAAVAVLAVSAVSHYVPAFPADGVLSVIRVVLGA